MRLNIEALLGNRHPHASFHDAKIEQVELDYLQRTATFHCLLYVGDPDEEPALREVTARGSLAFTSLLYFCIEPPDEAYSYDEGALDISGDAPVTVENWPEMAQRLPQDIPEEAFVHRFYVNNHNAYLIVAATGASFQWKLV